MVEIGNKINSLFAAVLSHVVAYIMTSYKSCFRSIGEENNALVSSFNIEVDGKILGRLQSNCWG